MGRIRLLVALPESPRTPITATATPTIARYEIGKELEELVVVLVVEVVVVVLDGVDVPVVIDVVDAVVVDVEVVDEPKTELLELLLTVVIEEEEEEEADVAVYA
ncbi:MAG: hypothetical protein ABSG45_01725, partial [Nitrososphaerales archaeon]